MKGDVEKTYVFIGLFLLIVISCHAQFTIGAKGGLNLSDVVINNLIDPDKESGFTMKPGIHMGLFVVADIGTRTSLSGEVLYSNKGVKAITAVHLHYLTIPLLVRYQFYEKWIVEGGPELGYLVNASSRYGNVNATWNNKIDLGLDVGVQYEASSRFSLGMRFNAGVSSVIKEKDMSSNGDPIRYQNRVLQLSVFYNLLSRGFRD